MSFFFETGSRIYGIVTPEKFIDRNEKVEFSLTLINFSDSERAKLGDFFSHADDSDEISLVLKITGETQSDEIKIDYFIVQDGFDINTNFRKLLTEFIFLVRIDGTANFHEYYSTGRKTTVFSQILEQLLTEDLVIAITKELNNFNDGLITRPEIQLFNSRFNDIFQSFTKNIGIFNPSLGIGDVNPNKLFKNFQLIFNQDGNSLDTDDLSAGMKILISNTLFQYLLELKLANKSGIILMDEPEVHLHPHNQRFLIDIWDEFIENRNSLSNTTKIQSIIATQSANIPSPIKKCRFIFLYQREFGKTIVKSDLSFEGDKKDKLLFAMIQHFPEIIFAKRIVILEGKTDLWYIKTLSSKIIDFNLDRQGISLVFAEGFTSIKKFFPLKNYFPFEVNALFDLDGGKNKYLEQECRDNNIPFMSLAFDIEKSIVNSISKSTLWDIFFSFPELFESRILGKYRNSIISFLGALGLPANGASNLLIKIIKLEERAYTTIFKLYQRKIASQKRLINDQLQNLIYQLLLENKFESTSIFIGNLIQKKDLRADIKKILKFITREN